MGFGFVESSILVDLEVWGGGGRSGGGSGRAGGGGGIYSVHKIWKFPLLLCVIYTTMQERNFSLGT